jgi:hypothetical protein
MPEVRGNGKGGRGNIVREDKHPGPYSARGMNPSSSKMIGSNFDTELKTI